MEKKRWYRLDNAGKLYPSIVKTRRSTVFRLSAKLRLAVDKTILQEALDVVIDRFPYYKVNLKRGMFWYYFEEAHHKPQVLEETFYPCMFLNIKGKKRFPFRVLYYNNYIHLEISHSIADGSSAMTFLKTLLVEYFRLRDQTICLNLEGAKAIDEEVAVEESEDAFRRYYQKGIPTPSKNVKACHFPFELMEKGRYLFLTGILPLKSVKTVTKAYDCSVTHLVTAVYFMAIQDYVHSLPEEKQKLMKGRIVMNVPVDLRQLYPSKTMKNFFVSFTPEMDLRLGSYELEELIYYVKNYMKQHYNKKYISRFISRNVKNERMLFVRLLPLGLKNLIMPYIYVKFGEKGYTSSISNMGKIRLPSEIEAEVEAIEFYPAPSEVNKIKMCMNAYGDYLYICFGKTTDNTEIEKYFFRRLRKMGIPVKIETNMLQRKEG